jgi:hypothetical protein
MVVLALRSTNNQLFLLLLVAVATTFFIISPDPSACFFSAESSLNRNDYSNDPLLQYRRKLEVGNGRNGKYQGLA